MLKNVRIKQKLLLMVVVPVLGLLLFSMWSVRDHYLLLKELRGTESLTTVAVRINALVHQIQKERGYASGYLNARGLRYAEELKKEHELVDAELKATADLIAARSGDLTSVAESLQSAGQAVRQLPAVRHRIETLELPGPELYTYYTNLVNSYTDVIAAIAVTAGKREVMRQATAYYAFTKAKEESGKERATFNAVLAADRLDLEKFQRISLIEAGQKIDLDLFRKYATPQAIALYERKAQNPEFRRVDEMRAAVLAKGLSGGFGIAPESWFDTITAKIDTMKEVEDYLSKEILETSRQMAAQAKQALVLSVVVTAALVLITFVMGGALMAGITKPLSRMLSILKDIAEGEGDLTKRLPVERRDELGEVSAWFNRFIENVHGIIAQMERNSCELSASCEHLNRSAEQIATAAERVASQSGTVATSSEEMSATSNDIARNCTSAASSSNRASERATGGAAVVQQSLVGMEQIAARVRETAGTVADLGERSDQIGAIVGTIEEIADQTNLLALNAAIEAARAGDQGRGFAVVADEVRALAERTTRATREIGEMIKRIQAVTNGAVGSMQLGVREVEKGMESSRKSGEALQEILGEINGVTMQIQQIATAAEEQTAVTGEITANIQEIDMVVRQSAQGAQETAAAAAHLLTLASDQRQVVGRFKLA